MQQTLQHAQFNYDENNNHEKPKLQPERLHNMVSLWKNHHSMLYTFFLTVHINNLKISSYSKGNMNNLHMEN